MEQGFTSHSTQNRSFRRRTASVLRIYRYNFDICCFKAVAFTKNRNWNPFCLYNYYLFTVNCRYTASLVSQIQKFKKLNLSGLTSIETQTVSPRKACSMSKFSQFYREKRYKTRISVSLNILCQICSNRHNS